MPWRPQLSDPTAGPRLSARLRLVLAASIASVFALGTTAAVLGSADEPIATLATETAAGPDDEEQDGGDERDDEADPGDEAARGQGRLAGTSPAAILGPGDDAGPEGYDPAPARPISGRRLAVVGGAVDDAARGTFGTVQAAIDAAQPGDLVEVAPGTYQETVHSVRSGTAGAPIRIHGQGAVLDGGGERDVVVLNHDHLELDGFEITGGQRLVLLHGANRVRVVGNTIHGAGGECLRVKYQSSANEIVANRIFDCGLEAFDLGEDRKNGEAVYIGTAPEQLDRNPTDDDDVSAGNWVHHNDLRPRAECVDVKEHAVANIVEHNTCHGSEDPDGAGFSSRGVRTVFRGNVSTGHAGSGIRLGGDDDEDGTYSVVVGNRIADNDRYGIKLQARPQTRICDNEVDGNGEGQANSDDVQPEEPCREGDGLSDDAAVHDEDDEDEGDEGEDDEEDDSGDGEG